MVQALRERRCSVQTQKISVMLSIQNLHVAAVGKPILKGLTP
jgi:hypothetical protein